MQIVQYSLLYIVQKMGLILRDPIFYLMAITVTYLYIRQIKKIHKEIDEKKYVIHSIKNTLLGIGIGTLVSSMLQVVGIQIALTTQVLILIPLAMGMLLINQRLGCFSYVVGVAYLLEGTLKLIGLPSYTLQYEPLIVLVGLLHLIEGLLIIIAGEHLPIEVPMYEKGKLIKAKLFQQVWLMPLILQVGGGLIPIYTVLAYGDVATSNKQKWVTGSLVMGYGIIMLCLMVCQSKWGLPLGGIMILMPVLHELIFVLSHGEIREIKKVDR